MDEVSIMLAHMKTTTQQLLGYVVHVGNKKDYVKLENVEIKAREILDICKVIRTKLDKK